jgi:hypothetical protein
VRGTVKHDSSWVVLVASMPALEGPLACLADAFGLRRRLGIEPTQHPRFKLGAKLGATRPNSQLFFFSWRQHMVTPPAVVQV